MEGIQVTGLIDTMEIIPVIGLMGTRKAFVWLGLWVPQKVSDWPEGNYGKKIGPSPGRDFHPVPPDYEPVWI
jgi:hypothetical protein